MVLARLAKSSIRIRKGIHETKKLGVLDKIMSSTIGRALATWKQHIKVVWVEMQSAKKDKAVTVKPIISNTLTGIYAKDSLKGRYSSY